MKGHVPLHRQRALSTALCRSVAAAAPPALALAAKQRGMWRDTRLPPCSIPGATSRCISESDVRVVWVGAEKRVVAEMRRELKAAVGTEDATEDVATLWSNTLTADAQDSVRALAKEVDEAQAEVAAVMGVQSKLQERVTALKDAKRALLSLMKQVLREDAERRKRVTPSTAAGAVAAAAAVAVAAAAAVAASGSVSASAVSPAPSPLAVKHSGSSPATGTDSMPGTPMAGVNSNTLTEPSYSPVAGRGITVATELGVPSVGTSAAAAGSAGGASATSTPGSTRGAGALGAGLIPRRGAPGDARPGLSASSTPGAFPVPGA
ncbi:MAG: hypothetical protein EOO41_05095, partial [Methanobacteriota archaeon]